MSSIKKVMTIAGSDSGAGAGIQADLKTFAAFGVYGTSVITAITAQNTQRVEAVVELPAEIIAAQIDAVVKDIGADAVKTGMLANASIVGTVADKIKEHQLTKLVVDPVMVAKSGLRLLSQDAVEVLKRDLLPLALVVTPNIPEAEVLTGHSIRSLADMRIAAKAIGEMGPKNVVVKGGHLNGDATDILWDGSSFHDFPGDRVNTNNTHGTGCTFASAIAACLAKGASPDQAVAEAKEYLTQALKSSFVLGRGYSPVHHFHHFWN